jgi:hypothetical protein
METKCMVIDMTSGEILATFPNVDEAWNWAEEQYPNSAQLVQDGWTYIQVDPHSKI